MLLAIFQPGNFKRGLRTVKRLRQLSGSKGKYNILGYLQKRQSPGLLPFLFDCT